MDTRRSASSWISAERYSGVCQCQPRSAQSRTVLLSTLEESLVSWESWGEHLCVCVCVWRVSPTLSFCSSAQNHANEPETQENRNGVLRETNHCALFFSLRPKLSPPLSFIVPSFISLHSPWRPCSSDLKRQHILHNRKNLKLRLRKLWLYLCASPPTSPMSESQACMIEMRAFTEQVRKTVVLRASFKGSISTRAACHCTFFVLFLCVCGVV